MYHKGIPFAEHNFGPFQDIFFVIVLFESQSKTLFTVLFSSLYQQICIFYFGISKYLNFTQELRRRFDRKIHFRSAKTLRCF
jgi:Cft2 family RNA processing exonuclease